MGKTEYTLFLTNLKEPFTNYYLDISAKDIKMAIDFSFSAIFIPKFDQRKLVHGNAESGGTILHVIGIGKCPQTV